VKLELEGDPIAARMCWCHDCQRLASGSATVNALFAPENVTVTGPITLHHKVADSGNTVERAFCTTCGSHVFSRPLLDPPVAYRIRAGALDNPEIARPPASSGRPAPLRGMDRPCRMRRRPKASPPAPVAASLKQAAPVGINPAGAASIGTSANIFCTAGRALIWAIQRERCGASLGLTSSGKL
jgi:hypothetical protein